MPGSKAIKYGNKEGAAYDTHTSRCSTEAERMQNIHSFATSNCWRNHPTSVHSIHFGAGSDSYACHSSHANEVLQKRNEETFGDIDGVHIIADDIIIGVHDDKRARRHTTQSHGKGAWKEHPSSAKTKFSFRWVKCTTWETS